MASLTLKNINKIYDNNVQAVFDFNIDIKDGEFIVLVGPSGCGKSTTLRMIAGLEDISSGQLIIDGKDVTQVPAKDRDIAMVFQNYALYPHMTVYKNLAFSLKLRKIPAEEIDERVKKAAQILQIEEYLDRTTTTGQYVEERYKTLTAIKTSTGWVDYEPNLLAEEGASDDYFKYENKFFKQKSTFGVRFISLKKLQFQLPISVGQVDVNKVAVTIKKIQSGEEIVSGVKCNKSWINSTLGQVENIPVPGALVGQSYKVQIAFEKSNEIR